MEICIECGLCGIVSEVPVQSTLNTTRTMLPTILAAHWTDMLGAGDAGTAVLARHGIGGHVVLTSQLAHNQHANHSRREKVQLT